MNRNEQHLLREVTYDVAHRNENVWWDLKRQTFDFGYQSWYPAQAYIRRWAEATVQSLPLETKAALLRQWRAARPPRAERSDAEILAAHARIAEAEVVSRARAAANRTLE